MTGYDSKPAIGSSLQRQFLQAVHINSTPQPRHYNLPSDDSEYIPIRHTPTHRSKENRNVDKQERD